MSLTKINTVILFKAVSEDCQDDDYYKYLNSKGFSVTVIPPIDFELINTNVLMQKLKSPENFSGIILSSPRCVMAVRLASKNINLTQWAHMPTFVVGKTTDKDATALGLNCVGQETGSAKRLAELIVTRQFKKPLLYPKSTLAADLLEDTLTKGNVAVESLEVYRTAPHPRLEEEFDKILQNLPAKMVFFSPSGVESVIPVLKQRNIDLQEIQFFAIGETTEKVMTSIGLTVVGKASKPTPESLTEALRQS